MRGPSSSHTAGSYHLGAIALSLLGEKPRRAAFRFDPDGSHARCYHEQGSDLAFVAALLGWRITDPNFREALSLAPTLGLDAGFAIVALAGADHPNSVRIELVGVSGRTISLLGKPIGGGAVEVTELEGWPVSLGGETHTVLVETGTDSVGEASHLLAGDGCLLSPTAMVVQGQDALVWARRSSALPPSLLVPLAAVASVSRIWQAEPLMFVKKGSVPFSSGKAILEAAESQGASLGELGIAYEAALLGLSPEAIQAEMGRRLEVMLSSVREWLSPDLPRMQLLSPTAATVMERDASGSLAVGGLHTRAAARAMAAMNVNCRMGVVCAAPTAGSAGVIPAVMATLCEELGADREKAVRCLYAAGLVGMVVAERATFAAEVAGCQVEIGAAGAMAAAAVVDAAGGHAGLALNAAAVCSRIQWARSVTSSRALSRFPATQEMPSPLPRPLWSPTSFWAATVTLSPWMRPSTPSMPWGA